MTAHGCQTAPRAYHAPVSRGPPERTLWGTTITEVLAGHYEPDDRGKEKPESLCGSLKVWAHPRRGGVGVARCTVERPMRG
ncbi:MAG: IS3-like element ISMysp3 family transposase, partial [Thermocrispum sp.]